MNKLTIEYFLKRIINSKDPGEYIKANSDLVWFINHRWTLAANEFTTSIQKITNLLTMN